MRYSRRQFTSFACMLTIIASIGGCAMFPSSKPSSEDSRTPESFVFTRGTLTIQSDQFISPDDRLVTSLIYLQESLRLQFGVPVSERPITIYLFDEPYEFRRFLDQDFPDLPQRRAFFLETEDALSGERHQADYVEALGRQYAAAQKSEAESIRRYQRGILPFLDALTAIVLRENLEINYVQARADLLANRVQLYRALGGDWTFILEQKQ